MSDETKTLGEARAFLRNLDHDIRVEGVKEQSGWGEWKGGSFLEEYKERYATFVVAV